MAAGENGAQVVLRERRLEVLDSVGAEKSPAIAEAEQGAVAYLQQAGILRPSDRVSRDERGRRPTHALLGAREQSWQSWRLRSAWLLFSSPKAFRLGARRKASRNSSLGPRTTAGGWGALSPTATPSAVNKMWGGGHSWWRFTKKPRRGRRGWRAGQDLG